MASRKFIIEFEAEEGRAEDIFKAFCSSLPVKNPVIRGLGRERPQVNFPGLWNVRRWDRTWLAAFEYAEDAAAFVGNHGGDKATVEWSHLIVWREGSAFDGEAMESYDLAAERMTQRRDSFFGKEG